MKGLNQAERQPADRTGKIAISPSRIAAVAILLLLWAGCSTPVGVNAVDGKEWRAETIGRGSGDFPFSGSSHSLLERWELTEMWSSDPDQVIGQLDVRREPASIRSVRLARAEAHLARACQFLNSRDLPSARGHLAGALVDSWFILADSPPVSENEEELVEAAIRSYNGSLMLLMTGGGRPDRPLAFGESEVRVPDSGLPLAIRKGQSFEEFAAFEAFLPADAFEIRGLQIRNRRDGLGLPLIGSKEDRRSGVRRTVPATLVARVEGSPAEIASGNGQILLDLHRPNEEGGVRFGANWLPQASDTTAPMAYALEDRRVWSLGRTLFIDSDPNLHSGIYLERPHLPGRIPVVLINGTISSPIVWAELVNYLHSDPVLSDRFEYWFFVYRTGNPVSFSADFLRTEIARLQQELDPDGSDPAMRQMVLIGHSQGGLLVRLVSTEPGDALWASISNKPFDEVHLSDRDRDLVRNSFFFEPLPEVRRVVFLATPHRGSILAKGFRSWMARKILHIPGQVTSAAADFLDPRNEIKIAGVSKYRAPHSIDSMSPTNPWLLALAALPTAPSIIAHSVIGIDDETSPPEGGDGVVSYRSAHLDGVESELVIMSEHSLQRHPETLAEIRRILYRHLEFCRNS